MILTIAFLVFSSTFLVVFSIVALHLADNVRMLWKKVCLDSIEIYLSACASHLDIVDRKDIQALNQANGLLKLRNNRRLLMQKIDTDYQLAIEEQ